MHHPIRRLFDLASDPFETRNLLKNPGSNISERAVGKAEHMRQLLVEWMGRHDTAEKFYSDGKYNRNIGGLISEIRNRKSWMTTNFWLSDSTLFFGPSAYTGKAYTRSEYIYVGRTTAGTLQIKSISLKGSKGVGRFSIDMKGPASIRQGGHLRIKVTFSSDKLSTIPSSSNAKVQIVYDAGSGIKTTEVALKAS